MSASDPRFIQSRDNPALKALRRLSQSNTDYRKQARVWVEGDHLLRAALARGQRPLVAVFAESCWNRVQSEYGRIAPETMVVPDALFAPLSALESPSTMGFVFALNAPTVPQPEVPSVVLDRVQDAGNVGAILRSASAFGFKQVLALTGTAALWSPKVLRAGMGAHWGLQLHEGLSLEAVQALTLPLLVTSSHQGEMLHALLRQHRLPSPANWAFGHEGQGICADLERLARLPVRIAQPGGEESLNVASAAAICLHASATNGAD